MSEAIAEKTLEDASTIRFAKPGDIITLDAGYEIGVFLRHGLNAGKSQAVVGMFHKADNDFIQTHTGKDRPYIVIQTEISVIMDYRFNAPCFKRPIMILPFDESKQRIKADGPLMLFAQESIKWSNEKPGRILISYPRRHTHDEAPIITDYSEILRAEKPTILRQLAEGLESSSTSNPVSAYLRALVKLAAQNKKIAEEDAAQKVEAAISNMKEAAAELLMRLPAKGERSEENIFNSLKVSLQLGMQEAELQGPRLPLVKSAKPGEHLNANSI